MIERLSWTNATELGLDMAKEALEHLRDAIRALSGVYSTRLKGELLELEARAHWLENTIALERERLDKRQFSASEDK